MKLKYDLLNITIIIYLMACIEKVICNIATIYLGYELSMNEE